jgi:hypothetical protein
MEKVHLDSGGLGVSDLNFSSKIHGANLFHGHSMRRRKRIDVATQRGQRIIR